MARLSWNGSRRLRNCTSCAKFRGSACGQLFTRSNGVHAASYTRRTFERSEEHTSELQSRLHLVCRLLLEKKKISIVFTVTAYSALWQAVQDDYAGLDTF